MSGLADCGTSCDYVVLCISLDWSTSPVVAVMRLRSSAVKLFAVFSFVSVFLGLIKTFKCYQFNSCGKAAIYRQKFFPILFRSF